MKIIKKKRLKEKIDFKYNLSVYWSILKKYKFLLFWALFIRLVMESIWLLDKYLFKIIIDKGTDFTAGIILRSELISILVIILIIFLATVKIKLKLKGGKNGK